MFAALDRYWDSDQSVVDEFVDTSVERLLQIREINKSCLTALETMGPDEYWQWRAEQPWSAGYIPSWRPPLEKVKSVCEKMVRCAEKTLRCRRVQ